MILTTFSSVVLFDIQLNLYFVFAFYFHNHDGSMGLMVLWLLVFLFFIYRVLHNWIETQVSMMSEDNGHFEDAYSDLTGGKLAFILLFVVLVLA